MCFAYDAHPPIAPIAGAAVDSQRIVLDSADGTRLNAFAAKPSKNNGVGVVVMPDVRGLFPFYEELALRFAELGCPSVAVDYFGRTAGLAARDESFAFMDHVVQTRFDTVAADVNAGIAYLRSSEGGTAKSIFTVGFCFGGARSWMQTAYTPDLTGAVGFYGQPGPGRDGAPGPLARAGELRGPLLLLQSKQDEDWIPLAIVDEFARALTANAIEHEMVLYDAPHSFFDRSAAEYAEASADAWRRIRAFITKCSGVLLG